MTAEQRNMLVFPDKCPQYPCTDPVASYNEQVLGMVRSLQNGHRTMLSYNKTPSLTEFLNKLKSVFSV